MAEPVRVNECYDMFENTQRVYPDFCASCRVVEAARYPAFAPLVGAGVTKMIWSCWTFSLVLREDISYFVKSSLSSVQP